MKKLEKMARILDDKFSKCLAVAAEKKFDLEVETRWDMLGNGGIITTRVDGEDFTVEQKAFFSAYEKGYLDAMLLVKKEALK